MSIAQVKVETTICINGATYAAESAKIDSVDMSLNKDNVLYWYLDLNFGGYNQQTNAHVLIDYVDINLLRELFQVIGQESLKSFAGTDVLAIFNTKYGEIIGLYGPRSGKHVIFSEFLESHKIRA